MNRSAPACRLLGLLLGFVATVALAAPKAAPPEIPLVTITSERSTLSAMRGNDAAVVNVWATWCPPCRVEMPSLDKLGTLLKREHIRVIALSVDTDHNLVQEFALKYGITLPIGVANDVRNTLDALEVKGLPATLYVAADGRIVGRHVGARDWAAPDAVAEIRAALGPAQPRSR